MTTTVHNNNAGENSTYISTQMSQIHVRKANAANLIKDQSMKTNLDQEQAIQETSKTSLPVFPVR